MNAIEELQDFKENHEHEMDDLSRMLKSADEEMAILKGESHSIKRLNEVLANQSQFFKDQILSKDEVIRSLLGGSQSPTLPKAA